jgi:hypothetical protein
MAYITTLPEYNAGGYEALCTLFGPDTADHLEAACIKQLTKVRP